MDLAASRHIPLGRSRAWPELARDGLLMGFFVAMACSISISQGLLALLCVLVLASPRAVGRANGREIRAAVTPGAEPWRDLASLRHHPLPPPFRPSPG